MKTRDILEKLNRENITYLWHWTSIENLPCIFFLRGLCSKGYLESLYSQGRIKKCWPPPQPGGNEESWKNDKELDNWNYISLNFTPYTPFAYHAKREKHICFFAINIEVATFNGVQFTTTNAASDYRSKGGYEILQKIRFDVIKSPPKPWDKENWKWPVQAEVLVPNFIGLDEVEKIFFISPASKKYAKFLLKKWKISNRLLKIFDKKAVIEETPFKDYDASIFSNTFSNQSLVTYPFVRDVRLKLNSNNLVLEIETSDLCKIYIKYLDKFYNLIGKEVLSFNDIYNLKKKVIMKKNINQISIIEIFLIISEEYIQKWAHIDKN